MSLFWLLDNKALLVFSTANFKVNRKRQGSPVQG